VTYVRNITDVDDKIIAASKATGGPIETITRRFAQIYRDDMASLNALPPDVEPRATDHIPQMIAMMKKLIASGHAYVEKDHVLFSVQTMADYGKLSRHSRDELIAGARVEVAPYKKDPADFVLWKPSDDDQPGWDSPWGKGRPGWHLECSAMSETHLGETFDIHGGGQDLIFPHHENEIAQSVCAHDGAPFVKYWMHNGYLTVDGEKMSKSLGNFHTVRELLEEGWHGEDIRLVLLSTHYRKPLDFTKAALGRAHRKLNRLYRTLLDAKDVDVAPGHPYPKVINALCDDLKTHAAVYQGLEQATKELEHALKRKDDARIKSTKSMVLASGNLLGILQQDPEEWFKGKNEDLVTRFRLSNVIATDEDWIYKMIAARAKAREEKNFDEGDRIRDELAEKGIILEDSTDSGTTWRRA
jgi:cysteinyl-tRNA synthetase